MRRYEYTARALWRDAEWHPGMGIPLTEDEQMALFNELGAEGWEVIQVDSGRALFKREVTR